jgi:hypothetical protein
MGIAESKTYDDQELVAGRQAETVSILNQMIPDPARVAEGLQNKPPVRLNKDGTPDKRFQPGWKGKQSQTMGKQQNQKAAGPEPTGRHNPSRQEELFREGLQTAIKVRNAMTPRDLMNCISVADEYVKIVTARFG